MHLTRSTGFVAALLLACNANPELNLSGSAGSATEAGSGGSGTAQASGAEGTSAVDGGSDDPTEALMTSTTGGSPIVLDVGTDEPAPECQTTVGDSIFLLGDDGTLHRFRPATHELETIGKPDCDWSAQPMAMTIDRDGMLWVMMVGLVDAREIFTVNPDTLECAKTDFSEGDLYTVGLAFVADAPGSEAESLYIGLNEGVPLDFNNPMSLGRIDLATMDLEILGAVEIVPNGYYQFADLTGTGEGKLFGFFPGDTAVLAEFDAPAAEVTSAEQLLFAVGSPWAFAQWGGRMWLFYFNGAGGSSVRTWDPVTGDVEDLADINAVVVGAAVSTCAPFTPEG